MEVKSKLSLLLKIIKRFLVNYLFDFILKIEDKFQQNTKKFYFFAILFTLVIFSFTFFSSGVFFEKKVIPKEKYTVIQSTNLLSIDRTTLKGKKIIFRPHLSKEERSITLRDFVPVAQTIDLNSLLISVELQSSNSKKIKDYYRRVLKALLDKTFLKPNDNYITTGLIQELLPSTLKRETLKSTRE